VNDQEALTRDPAMRAVVGKKALDRNAASSQTVSRFETEILTQEENIKALSSINDAWVSKAISSTKTRKLYFRGDAAFASPDVYEYLEEKGILYAVRIPANDVLLREIDHLMTRPVGRPPKKPRVFFHSFSYRAKSWKRSRRGIAKVISHARRTVFQMAEVTVPGELFEDLLGRIRCLSASPT
jgi:hypothetical protein